jgi:hypothetical protein
MIQAIDRFTFDIWDAGSEPADPAAPSRPFRRAQRGERLLLPAAPPQRSRVTRRAASHTF